MTNLFLTYLGISATVGAVVLLILLASPFINRRYAAKWKYYIWIFLAIRLLIPLSGMYHNPGSSQVPPVTDTAPINSTAVYEPTETPPAQLRRFVVEIPVGTVGQYAQAPDTTADKPKPTLFDVIIAAWIAGAVVFVLVPLISCLHYKYRILRGGRRITGGSAYDALQRAKSQLKIKRKVSLIRYVRAASPMIIGFVRPALVLPCDEYSEEELQFIIRHELIHLKRGDVYIKLLCVLANALHWFNPLIWIMRREAAIDMEISCDEGVIKGADFGVKKAYTETLMSSLRRQSSKRSSLTTQFYGGKSTMKKRFTNILGNRAKKNGIAVLICAVVLATLLGVLVGCTQKDSSDNTPEELNGYVAFEKADIPDIHYDGSFGLDELNEKAFPKVLFDTKEAGGRRIYLLGEHVRTDKSENENAVYSYYLSLGTVNDGAMITSPLPVELEGASQGGYILNKNALPDYLSVYGMDCPLAVLRYTSSGGAQLSAFYAVKDGSLYMLMGDSSAVGGETAGVCVSGISQDVTVSGNTLKDNASGVTYSFNFDNILPNDYVGAHFTASANSNDEPKPTVPDDELNLPQGYAYNIFEGRVGQLEHGGVSFKNHDESAAFGFILPEDWSLGASVAYCGDFKVFEIGGFFKTEELSADKVMATDGNAVFPTTAKNDEGEPVTIYAEEMSDAGLYDYMCHSSSVLGNGEIYEKYLYIVSRGGYSVYVTFVVNDYYSTEICETVLNSFAYVGTHFTASANVDDTPAVRPEESVELTDETTSLANDILANLEQNYKTTVDILTMHMTEPIDLVEGVDQLGNLRDIDGVTYVPMVEEYDTVDKIMEAFHKVYTNEKCDTLYSQYLDEDSTGFMKEVDGKLYAMAIGEQGHNFFKLPITGAEKISETEILAKTSVTYDFGDVPYEITLKYEDGAWKIDKLIEYMSEEGREMSY